jgi:hypothetical protein
VKRFLSNCEGGVVPLMALGIIPLMVSVGAAVDYSRGNAARTDMQAALDAAAIMATKDAGTAGSGDVSSYFYANFTRQDVKTVQVSSSTSNNSGGTSVSLAATGTLPTEFLALIGISNILLSVNSEAFISSDGLGCVLSLNRSASGATSLQGNAAVNLMAAAFMITHRVQQRSM